MDAPKPSSKKKYIIGAVIVVIIIAIVLGVVLGRKKKSDDSSAPATETTPATSNTTPATTTTPSTPASTAPSTPAPAAHSGTGEQGPVFGGGGGAPYDMSCPDGKIMTNISGRGGWWIDQLKGKCDDGSQKGPVGGQGGGPVDTQDCPQGYTGVDVTYGQFMGKLTPKCQGAPISTPIGGGLGSGSGTNATYECPSGKVITGLTGKAGSYVDSTQITCK